jgi:predicted RNase H-like nuclease (RuvC/YqgF family)
MGEISELIGFIKTTATFGGVGIWTIVMMMAWSLWKGLPSVLDAWTNRQSKEAERTDREITRLEAQIGRLEGQIASADDRHEECLKKQDEMRDQITTLQRTIDGLIAQMRQVGISAVRNEVANLPPPIAAMVEALDRLPGVNG